MAATVPGESFSVLAILFMDIPSARRWTTLPYFSGSCFAGVDPVKRDGHVSSGVVSAGKLSGMIWTRFFLVGMGVMG